MTSAPPGECGLAVRVPAGPQPDLAAQRQPVAAAGRPRLPGHPAALAARRRAHAATCRHAPADLPRPAHRRAARDRGHRARPARVLLRAGRPARRAGPRRPRAAPRATARPGGHLPGVGARSSSRPRRCACPPAGDGGPALRPGRTSRAAAGPATATAIPYFQWDNRDGRAMRVWMPLSLTASAAAAQEGERSECPVGSAADHSVRRPGPGRAGRARPGGRVSRVAG